MQKSRPRDPLACPVCGDHPSPGRLHRGRVYCRKHHPKPEPPRKENNVRCYVSL